MRAPAAVLAALLILGGSAVAHHSSGHPVLHLHGVGPGWSMTKATAPAEVLRFVVGADLEHGFVGQLVHVYRADGGLVAAFVVVFERDAQPVLRVQAGDVGLSSADLLPAPHGTVSGIATVDLRCSASCSADREFTILASSGGDVLQWGVGLFTHGGTAGATLGTGDRTGALRTRDFDGDRAQLAARGLGVAAASGVSHTIEVTDGFVGMFGRLSGPVMEASAQTPAGARACFCVIDGGAPGAYTFRYTDLDPFGEDGVLVWADVRMR